MARLEEVFQLIEKKPQGKTCDALAVFPLYYQRPFPAPGRPDVGRSLPESVRSPARTVNATVRQRMAIKRERLRAAVS